MLEVSESTKNVSGGTSAYIVRTSAVCLFDIQLQKIRKDAAINPTWLTFFVKQKMTPHPLVRLALVSEEKDVLRDTKTLESQSF